MLELNTNLLAEIGGWPALKEARGLVERGEEAVVYLGDGEAVRTISSDGVPRAGLITAARFEDNADRVLREGFA